MNRRHSLWILLGGALPAVAQVQTTWEQVQKRGVLRVAADPTLGLPYFAVDQARQYQGFEWEILQALGSALGVQIRITEVLWPQQREVLTQGGVDMVLNNQEALDLKNQAFLLTRPYYITSQSVLSAKPIQQFMDLVGQRVGIIAKSGGAALIEGYNLYKSRAIHPFSGSSPEDLVQKLQSGRLDALILDTPYVRWLGKQPGLIVAEFTLLPVPLVAVVRATDSSLQKALDQGLQQLYQRGTLEIILRKWQLWNALQMLPRPRFSPRG